ncbi:hypothetical protein PGT21_022874 [Puccinia graminis f. sp. tritici]|uniref:Uncharacterized protein n=1 Tax=Puccinia graminis f. sp. tritici TaxID=56615 RepID=A0A5B0NR53_PUCGR|nr:hypothetical protein PGT21_022874 [Puccinia graminis f. sp. tritici]KAA1125463.1 hypothetical protein PGTUg99_018136 [Puccinia graminis f. sp. tritici]
MVLSSTTTTVATTASVAYRPLPRFLLRLLHQLSSPLLHLLLPSSTTVCDLAIDSSSPSLDHSLHSHLPLRLSLPNDLIVLDRCLCLASDNLSLPPTSTSPQSLDNFDFAPTLLAASLLLFQLHPLLQSLPSFAPTPSLPPSFHLLFAPKPSIALQLILASISTHHILISATSTRLVSNLNLLHPCSVHTNSSSLPRFNLISPPSPTTTSFTDIASTLLTQSVLSSLVQSRGGVLSFSPLWLLLTKITYTFPHFSFLYPFLNHLELD